MAVAPATVLLLLPLVVADGGSGLVVASSFLRAAIRVRLSTVVEEEDKSSLPVVAVGEIILFEPGLFVAIFSFAIRRSLAPLDSGMEEEEGERETAGNNAVAVAVFAGEPLGVVVVVCDFESPGGVTGILNGDGQGLDPVVFWDCDATEVHFETETLARGSEHSSLSLLSMDVLVVGRASESSLVVWLMISNKVLMLGTSVAPPFLQCLPLPG